MKYSEFKFDDSFEPATKSVHDDGKVRVTRDRWNILVEELPRKPCKRTLTSWHINLHYQISVLGLDAFLVVNILSDAQLEKSDTFTQVLAKIEAAIQAAVDAEQREKLASALRTFAKPNGYSRDVHYTKVTPEGVEPIEIRGADFSFEVKWDHFITYAPGSTMHYHDGDPHYTAYESRSPAAARKLYKLAQKLKKLAGDDAEFAPLLFKHSKLTDFLAAQKIAFEYRFSVWS